MIVKGGFVHVAFALIKRITIVYRDMTNDELNELEKEKAELPQEEATQQDRIEAQVMYTALMTDTLLEGESNV